MYVLKTIFINKYRYAYRNIKKDGYIGYTALERSAILDTPWDVFGCTPMLRAAAQVRVAFVYLTKRTGLDMKYFIIFNLK